MTTSAPRSSHRAELPTIESGTGARALLIGGTVAALAVGLGIAFGLTWMGVGSGRTLFPLTFVPLALYFTWMRRRRERRLALASTVMSIEASPGRLVVAGRPSRASSLDYERGLLRVHLRLGLSQVAFWVTPAAARALADALAVPEQGLRTVHVWGPVASVPVLGSLVLFAAPGLALFAALVLLLGSNLSGLATLAFAVTFATTAAMTVLVIPRRTLYVADDHVQLSWLGRTRSIPMVSIESITISGAAIVLRARGERALRLPLIPVSSVTTIAIEDARARAAARAEEPIALASQRTIARIFE